MASSCASIAIAAVLLLSFRNANVFAESIARADAPGPRKLWMPSEPAHDPTFLSLPAPQSDALPLTPKQKEQLRFMQRVDQLIARLDLTLENGGFHDKMPADQEFRLYKNTKTGRPSILFNPKFWFTMEHRHDYDQLVKYTLLRAEAVYYFRSHFDADQFGWVFQEEEAGWRAPVKMLRATASNAEGWGPVVQTITDRDLEVRKSAERSGKVFEVLLRRAVWAIEERAADQWVLERVQESWGFVSPLVKERVDARERALAADFARTRSAMIPAEREQFFKLLRNPVHYGVRMPRLPD